MAFYQASWLILLSPLFSFAVIVFGTRMWDLATRGRVMATSSPQEREEAEEESGIQMMEERGPHGEEETLEDDEDPKVPRLTTGARVSGYLGILIMGLACIYSWLLLLDSAHVINISGYTLPAGGMTVLSYDWFSQGTASYLIAYRIDTLAIAMMVVVTTISLLVQFYSLRSRRRTSSPGAASISSGAISASGTAL
jgi:NADH-quinone oxidoreductase subunit L